MRKYVLSTIAAAVALCASASAQTITHDFNNQTTFQNNFTTVGSTFYNTTGGLSDSGSLSGSGGASQTVWYNPTITLTAGGDITLSAYFLARVANSINNGSPSPAGGDSMRLGIANAKTAEMSANGGTSFVGFGIEDVNIAEGTTSRLVAVRRETNPFNTVVTLDANGASPFSLTNNSWYFLTTTITKSATTTGEFSLIGSLFNSSSTGVVGDLVTSATATTITGANTVYGVNDIFAGVGGYSQNPNGGVTRIDNFTSPIPEPSTVAMLLGGTAALLGFRRVRQKPPA
jgi:hypothetical protein